MSPEECLALAERYRKLLDTATDPFTRYHLEAMERSYRVLADSERAVRRSRRIVDALDELGNDDEEKTVAEVKAGS
ncbi:hypothetical protein [Bradyrhizobium sp. F1.13.3]|uniref:hypothetical protein n=1 Tax=Bradyrhizobium sp. F1.13.3 TaxID=3156351 RepID=UPI003394BF04